MKAGSPYFLYMAEAEGLDNVVDTREAQLNAAINEFRRLKSSGVNINKIDIQDYIFSKHSLNLHQLSEVERRRVAMEVN